LIRCRDGTQKGSAVLIAGGMVLDPGHLEGAADVFIEDGVIVAIGPDLAHSIHRSALEVIGAKGCLVLPGLVDLHVHLREPGFEYKETIATGTAAAVAGGFTSICCMPNSKPVNDNPMVTRLIQGKAVEADHAHVYPIGAITKGSAGRELTDFRLLREAGCVALSDDGRPIMDDQVMRQAMHRAAEVGLSVIDHCEDLTLSGCGCMNEGPVSRALGLQAMPAEAEERIVARDIALTRETGARLHVAHVSTAGTVAAIRRAKEQALPVTAEVCPHHLILTEEAVRQQGPNAKMNPPLRSERDRAALVEGLADGTIDAIATDHAPHAEYEKQWGMDRAPFGIVGLETALGLTMSLVQAGCLSLSRAVSCLTQGPAAILGLPKGTLKPGSDADVTIVDPHMTWTVDPDEFFSKGRNTPFAGCTLKGRAIWTVVGGQTVYALDLLKGGRV